MTSFASAIHDQVNAPHCLSDAMAFFVGKPSASRLEVINAIRIYATENRLNRADTTIIKPNIVLAALLARPAPFDIKDINTLVSRHLMDV